MQKNIGTVDRLLRFLAGLALLAYALWASSWIALLIAAFCFYEALASWCVLYQLLGKNTCPLDKR